MDPANIQNSNSITDSFADKKFSLCRKLRLTCLRWFAASGFALCWIALTAAVTFVSSFAIAQNTAPTSVEIKEPSHAFTAGIVAFKKNDFKTASLEFQKALVEAPHSTSVLHNLALTEWKLDQRGLALALWRKAVVIDPAYEPAERSIKWFRSRLDHPEIAHELEYWETFREEFLTHLSLSWIIVLNAATLLMSGSLLLKYFGAKRRSAADETTVPDFPSSGIAASLLFLLLLTLTAAKLYDMNSPRGTILPTKVQAKSAPDASSTALFDLYAGLEVQIDQAPHDWLQVTYPGGPTGWIPASALMRTTDAFPTNVEMNSEPTEGGRVNFLWDNIFRQLKKDSDLNAVLKENFIFQDLSARELGLLEGIVHVRKYHAGEPVFRQGEVGIGMYIIVKGQIEIFASGPSHSGSSGQLEETRDIFITQLSPGDFFGELSLVEENGRRSASAVARDETTLIGFFKPDLMEMRSRSPLTSTKIIFRLAEILGRRLKETTEKVSELRRALRDVRVPPTHSAIANGFAAGGASSSPPVTNSNNEGRDGSQA